VKRIIAESKAPYDTIWRLVAETGIRRGEVCGLNVGDVDLVDHIIAVKRSVSRKRKLKSPNNGKARAFALSPQLADVLRRYGRSERGRTVVPVEERKASGARQFC
jgi:integrase